MAAADVMQLKTEPLHFLKVVIHCEDLGENRNDAAANHLRPVHLQPIRTCQMSEWSNLTSVFKALFKMTSVGISAVLYDSIH